MTSPKHTLRVVENRDAPLDPAVLSQEALDEGQGASSRLVGIVAAYLALKIQMQILLLNRANSRRSLKESLRSESEDASVAIRWSNELSTAVKHTGELIDALGDLFDELTQDDLGCMRPSALQALAKT